VISPWRRPLLPFVPAYAAAIKLKHFLRVRGVLKQRRLNHPVISIGSLSAGGAGKTPVVLMFAELLRQRGLEVRILTRGYGRTGTLTERVSPAGDAARFGDEPLLIARRAPEAKVFVGRDRYDAGTLSEHDDAPRTNAIYVLDDGFQHQQLSRDLEILLVTLQDIRDSLLPAGNLREPLRSIHRADFLVLREDEVDLADLLTARLPFALPPILTIRRKLKLPASLFRPVRPVIFSGLARPQGLIAMLSKEGLDTSTTMTFPDHHRYSIEDMERLTAFATKNGADGFATTEKDAVKLSVPMLQHLEKTGPLIVARLQVELLDEVAAFESVIARLALHEKIRS
jgi:tetraacyldisaccharide 4'-kinase